jgi:hypothetical protein
MTSRLLNSVDIGVSGLDEGDQNRIQVSHRISGRGGKSMATKVFVYGKVD